MERPPPGQHHTLGGGIVAGIIGGAVIAIIMVVAALAAHQDLWIGLKTAAAPFLGDRALRPGFDLGAVALGVISHFAISMVWGIQFAALFSGLSKPATVMAGAVWGIVVWFGMFFIVLPIAGLKQMADAEPVGKTVISHVLFGLAVGIGFLPFQRSRPHASPPITHIPLVY